MRDIGSRGRLRLAAGVSAIAAVFAAFPAFPQDVPAARREALNLYGVTGLIDMPSARVQPDGQIGFTTSYSGGGFLRNTLTFQVLPRLEASFRYSIIDDFFDGGGDLYDRSFDLKLLISDETRVSPAVAVGLQDFLGTGIHSGEYIVASKALRPNLTATGGVGWGRFSDLNGVRNPVRALGDWAADRDAADADPGEVRFGQFFRGEDIGFFGGLEWRPDAVDGLTLKAEYSSDDYSREGRYGDFRPEIPFNFGAEYRLNDSITLGAYALNGTTYGLRASVSFNPLAPIAPQNVEPGPPPLRARPAPPLGASPALGEVIERISEAPAPGSDARLADVMLDAATEGARWGRVRLEGPALACPEGAARDVDARLGVVDAVTFLDPSGRAVCTVVLRPGGRRLAAARSGPAAPWDRSWHDDPETRARVRRQALRAVRSERMIVNALEVQPGRVAIEIRNETFNAAPQAIGRTAAALAGVLPPSVEVFDITVVERGLPAVLVRLRRARLEETVHSFDAPRRSWLGAEIMDPPLDAVARPRPVDGAYPRIYWGLNPHVPLGFFDPDDPLRYDVRLRVEGGLEFTPGLSVNGRVSQRIFGELGDIERPSDSQLPRVRSEFARYFENDTPVLERLTLDHVFKVAPDVYGRLSGGILEEMFAGVGGEVLWKSAERNWGLGADLNWAVKRDYDMGFGLQDYDVVTGHASFYWDTGWHGLKAQVDAGRYLAGDWGATVSLTRRFANGWELGGFFTLTDVPFDEYGEGSFDKGIRLTIPLDWSLPGAGRAKYSTVIRPLTRDGGARLNIANRLYPAVQDLDRGGLREDWGNFWK